jgi:hypothetical protein
MKTTGFDDIDSGPISPSRITPPDNSSSATAATSSSSAAPAVSAGASTKASPAIDPRFERYSTMRKVLPEMALRHKLSADGFTDAEIDAYFRATSLDDEPSRAPVANPSASSTQSSSMKPAASVASAPTTSSTSSSGSAPPAAAAAAIAAGKIPPKATGGRANLLASIAARRIE